jgi:hypothetical protein
MSKLSTMLVAAAVAGIAVTSVSVPAHAAVMHQVMSAKPRAAGAGVYQCNNTPNQTVSMRSSPHPDTYYVGTAHQGDCLADICWTVGADGAAWDLVLDRNGLTGDHFADTAAFIPERDLISTAQSLYCDNLVQGDFPTGPYVNGVNQNVAMRSAPQFSTYVVGTASPRHNFIDVCVDSDGIGNFFHLVLDEQGVGGNRYAYTTAFIPEGALVMTVPFPNAMEEPC